MKLYIHHNPLIEGYLDQTVEVKGRFGLFLIPFDSTSHADFSTFLWISPKKRGLDKIPPKPLFFLSIAGH
jgi:hypothetical protein